MGKFHGVANLIFFSNLTMSPNHNMNLFHIIEPYPEEGPATQQMSIERGVSIHYHNLG